LQFLLLLVWAAFDLLWAVVSVARPIGLRRSPRQAVVPLFLLGLFLSLHALAAFQLFHKAVCRDADAADHQCAATLFAKGQIDRAVENTPLRLPPAIALEGPQPVSFLLVSVEHLEPPGRGPPISLL
jgi:hypothetical protein